MSFCIFGIRHSTRNVGFLLGTVHCTLCHFAHLVKRRSFIRRTRANVHSFIYHERDATSKNDVWVKNYTKPTKNKFKFFPSMNEIYFAFLMSMLMSFKCKNLGKLEFTFGKTIGMNLGIKQVLLIENQRSRVFHYCRFKGTVL
jgi:hypothetical protein